MRPTAADRTYAARWMGREKAIQAASGLQLKSDGLQPRSDGLQPKSDGLQPTSSLHQLKGFGCYQRGLTVWL